MAAVAFPFVCLPDAAIWQPGLSSHAKCLLAALIHHRNRKTGLCNPNLSSLAEMLGKSLSTIKRALVELRRLGMVIVRRSLWGNRYELPTPDEWHDVSFSSNVTPAEGSTVTPRMAHGRAVPLEPDEFNQKVTAAAVLNAPAAAAASPPRVLPEPNAPASPPAGLWNGPAEASPQPTQTLPAVPGRIRALAQAMSERLLAAPHPNPICQDRAAPAIEAILRAAPDVEATAAKIWDNHAAWMEEWKTQSPCKAPQLWAWFQWGHWENPPLVRKPAGREDLADQAIRRWRERIAAGEKPF